MAFTLELEALGRVRDTAPTVVSAIHAGVSAAPDLTNGHVRVCFLAIEIDRRAGLLNQPPTHKTRSTKDNIVRVPLPEAMIGVIRRGLLNDYSSDASVGVSTELSNKSTAPPDYSHQTRHKSEMLQEGTAILRKHIQLPNEERFKLGFTTLIGNIITNHIFIRITTNRTNEKAT